MADIDEFWWLLLRLTPLRWRIVFGLVCVLLASAVVTLDPLLLLSLIDKALPRRNLHLALVLVCGIGLCYFLRNVFYAMWSLVNFSIVQYCVRDLRTTLIMQMNRLSVEYHERTPTGEKLTNIDHDVDEIANLGADTASQSVRAALLLILNITMMVRLNLPMTFALLPFIPMFVLIQWHFSRLLKMKAEDARSKVGAATTLLNEHLASIPQIQLLGAEGTSAKRTISVFEGQLQAQWGQRRTQIGFSVSVGSIIICAIVIALAFGSVEVLRNALTIGGLVAFYTYGSRVFEPISSAMDLYARIQCVRASIRRVREVLALEPSVRDTGTRELQCNCLSQGFKIEEVSFFYDRKAALNAVNLSLDAGERIAIIGPSGSGKSTLVRLLVRIADPNSGRVLLDSRPLTDYTLASLREAVCYVPQNPVLFQGTIRENLLFATPDATTEEIDRAIETAQLVSKCYAPQHDIDSSLGPSAAFLSGGERQRLAIARSLLRKPTILILDEATSALDAQTEQAVFKGLNNTFQAKQTLIIISHRVSSLTWLDRLIVLDHGRIVATGSHSSLYSSSALYRSLFDASYKESLERDFEGAPLPL